MTGALHAYVGMPPEIILFEMIYYYATIVTMEWMQSKMSLFLLILVICQCSLLLVLYMVLAKESNGQPLYDIAKTIRLTRYLDMNGEIQHDVCLFLYLLANAQMKHTIKSHLYLRKHSINWYFIKIEPVIGHVALNQTWLMDNARSVEFVSQKINVIAIKSSN